jgi:hypothetical protein
MSGGGASFLHVVVANDANVVSEAVADSASLGASQLVPQTRVLLASARADTEGGGTVKHVALEGDRFFCFSREGAFTFACVVDAPQLASRQLLQQRVAEFLSAVRNAYVLNSKSGAAADDPEEDELLLGSPFAMSDTPLDEQLRRLLREFNNTSQHTQAQPRDPPVSHVIQMPPQDPTASVSYAAGDQYRAYASEVQEKEHQRKVRAIAAASCVGAVVLFWFLL